MIELIWKDSSLNEYENILQITNLLSWLVAIIRDKHEIELNGFMVLKEKNPLTYSILLILGDENSQKQTLNILQQPPEEFKEKYIARIPCEEPNPVKEKDDDSSDDDECELELSEET